MSAEPEFAPEDDERIDKSLPLRADHVFEVIRREGDAELSRPNSSLAWSGFAAGLAIGFSVVAEAMLARRLPDTGWAELIADGGYTVGFLIVILGRLQLFTEHTVTAVMPVVHAPCVENVMRLARLWGIVLAANMAGAVLFALFIMKTGALPLEAIEAVLALGRHMSDDPFFVTIAKGAAAGFLIAAMVWMLPSAKSGEVAIIFIVTYVIAMAEFAHVIAGSVEVAALVLEGQASVGRAVFGFFVPALIGNIIGGTVLFALLAYSQIKLEVSPQPEERPLR